MPSWAYLVVTYSLLCVDKGRGWAGCDVGGKIARQMGFTTNPLTVRRPPLTGGRMITSGNTLVDMVALLVGVTGGSGASMTVANHMSNSSKKKDE